MIKNNYKKNLDKIKSEKDEKKKSLMTKKFIDDFDEWRFCEECGDILFPNVDKERWRGITVHLDNCPICGENKTMIPLDDWYYANGNNLYWD